MTPQELKNSILQLAIQGKLVEQRSEEGTGEELYRQIQEEKQRLIKEGKIKKEKPLPEILENEKPFDIPRSWMWVRIGTILHKLVDGTHKTPKYTTFGVPFVSVRNISNGRLNLDDTKFISEEEHKQLFERCNPAKGDILLSKVGTTGVPAKVDTDVVFSLFVSVALLKFNTALIDIDFLIYAILTPDFQKQCKEHTRGVGNKNWVIADIANTVFPLPPLAEQKRIVAKIEELLPYIDRYEQAWNRLEDFNKRFPDDMEKSILQMAIQGKLVEQRPEEGTAEELYQQIQTEKRQLIKDGKIKKEKSLPEISEDEIPFDIPENWKWVRLKDIISILGDGIHGTPEFDNQGKYFFINGNNLAKGKIIIKSDTKRVSRTEYEKYKKPLNERSILLSINGTIGNYAYYTDEPVILGKSACYFSLINGISKDYICYLLNTKWFSDYAVNEATQTTIKNVSLKAMRMLPIPLPPLIEQERIVAKLKEILPLCEMLK